MNNIVVIYSLISVIIISLISFVGAFAFFIKENTLKRIIMYMVSFSIGTMLSAGFLHLIPEAMETEPNTLFYVVVGFLFSFILEKFIKWRHCHNPNHFYKEVHPFAYINLVGDMVHNFIDGIVIAASYIISIPLGIATTLAVMIHEIPQEIGDFAVLIHGGFSRKKALLLNFFTALTAVVGVVLGLYIGSSNTWLVSFLIAFAAGNFIYIAASDLIPELHKEETKLKNSLLQLLFIVLGILIIALL
ncbi:MAG: ZIP family metal transporter [Candidatus Pacebacteria bacterium]|nr:ZIP family metal transporter [Candidatus Paceibacterota bacterium]